MSTIVLCVCESEGGGMTVKFWETGDHLLQVFYFERRTYVIVMWPLARCHMTWLNFVNMALRFGETVTPWLVFQVLCLLCWSVRAEIRTAVINKQTGQLSVLEEYQDDFVAWANFTDDIKNSGWVVLIWYQCWNFAPFWYVR